LYIDSLSATSLKSNADGQTGSALPSRSSRTMTMVTPAGPMFFCAPAKITPYLATSITRDRMCEDMSATSTRSARIAEVRLVLDAVDGLVGAHVQVGCVGGVSCHSACAGTALVFEAAVFTLAYLPASLMDLADHEPV
jgi:hypothetical protein